MSEAKGVNPPSNQGLSPEWSFSDLKLKTYPHFDEKLKKKQILALVNCPESVASHGFMPFLHYGIEYQPYRGKGLIQVPDKKTRPIRYACRADSYVYSRYRHKLVELYEQRLIETNLQDCVLAYRRVPLHKSSKKHKSNIDFAKDAFDYIRSLGNCIVVTADIKSYFDNIDHNNLKNIWCNLLGVSRLPDDHYNVFRNVTNYRYMDYVEVCRQLNFFGQKTEHNEGFLVNRKRMPTKMANNDRIKRLFTDRDSKGGRLLKFNNASRGIPQGSPISDVLANMYLLNFDARCRDFANKASGRYFRYSDDILMVFPKPSDETHISVENFLRKEISKEGSHLTIQDKKFASVEYTSIGDRQHATPLSPLNSITEKGNPKFKMANGLLYLGFRYDGEKVFLKNSTISNLYRKISKSALAEAMQHRKNYPLASENRLVELMQFEKFFQKFGRVEKFSQFAKKPGKSHKHWTFHTYALRASKTFGKRGDKIMGQLSKARKLGRTKLENKIRLVAKWYPAQK